MANLRLQIEPANSALRPPGAAGSAGGGAGRGNLWCGRRSMQESGRNGPVGLVRKAIDRQWNITNSRCLPAIIRNVWNVHELLREWGAVLGWLIVGVGDAPTRPSPCTRPWGEGPAGGEAMDRGLRLARTGYTCRCWSCSLNCQDAADAAANGRNAPLNLCPIGNPRNPSPRKSGSPGIAPGIVHSYGLRRRMYVP